MTKDHAAFIQRIITISDLIKDLEQAEDDLTKLEM